MHWDETQVQEYIHHSELQRLSTWQLLSTIDLKGSENILDVGCGDGRNSAWMALTVRNGSVHGIDPNDAMLSWAKKQYHPIDFPNLTFEKGSFDNLGNDLSYDIVTSFFSIHCVQDKKKAMQEVYRVLKESGRFICVAPPPPTSNMLYFQAVCDVIKTDKWKSYFETFSPRFHFTQLEDYKEAIIDAGLKLDSAKYVKTIDPFVNDAEFVNWFKGTMPHRQYLPKDLQDEFVYDIIKIYTNLCPDARGPDNTLRLFWGRFELTASK